MKCLVTKLKEAINNDSLPRLGEIIFSVNSSSTPQGQYLRLETEGVTLDIPSEYVRPDSTHVANGVYDIKAFSKYDMTKLIVGRGISYSSNDLRYCSNLEILLLYYLYNDKDVSDISFLENLTKMKQLVIEGNKSGNLDSISNLINITSLDVVTNTMLTGDITSVSKMVNCTLFNFTSSSLLTGSLESLCESLRTNGKTSGTFNFRGNGTLISFNNVVIPLNSYRYVRYLDGVITVATDASYTAVIGTYDGTSWSYN